MRLFVTGATGFIGTHLTRALLAEGHEVTALVRTPAKLAPDLVDRIAIVEGDLSIFRDASLALPEVDVVVHLAAVVAGKDDEEYGRINHEAVRDLLGAIERQPWTPRRLLFASSLAAAGPSPADRALTEDDPPAPLDPYGAAKLAAEGLMDAVPYPTTTFRPCIVLGPGDPASLTLFKMARTGLGFRVGGPSQRLSYIDVADLVSGIVAMAGDESDADRLYFVAHDGETSPADLFAAIGAAMGKRVAVIPIPRTLLRVLSAVMTAAARVIPFTNQLDRKQYAQMTAPAFLCSSERLQRDTGWRPAVDLPSSAETAFAGYRTLGWL